MLDKHNTGKVTYTSLDDFKAEILLIMKYQFILSDEAKQDIKDAKDYYNKNR